MDKIDKKELARYRYLCCTMNCKADMLELDKLREKYGHLSHKEVYGILHEPVREIFSQGINSEN